MTKMIAIDLGSSNGRVMLGSLDKEFLKIEEIHRFDHKPVSDDGRLRWNWTLIIENIREGLNKVGGRSDAAEIRSVSCDSWAQDFGLLDQDWNLSYPPVCYRDSRTEGMPNSFSDLVSPKELLRCVGGAVAPITTLCQLKAMSEDEPEILERATTLLHVADLIQLEICGSLNTDWTFATVDQLRNVETGEWDRELLWRLGVPHHFLPPIVEVPRKIGTINSSELDASLRGLPVIGGMGHDTSSATAALSAEPGTLFLSAGSWGMLGCVIGPDFPQKQMQDQDESIAVIGVSRRNWAMFHGGMGMWVVQQCRREWNREGSSHSYDDLADAASRSDWSGTIDLNDDRFINPKDMRDELAQCCEQSGLSKPKTVADTMKLIYDSLVEGFNHSIEKLAQASGHHFKRIHVISGGAKDPFLCRKLAERVGMSVHAGPAEATIIGNFMTQARVLGLIDNEDQQSEILENSFKAKVYQP